MFTYQEELPVELTRGLERLVNEHEVIRADIIKVEKLIRELKDRGTPEFHDILNLKCQTDALAESLQIHVNWEAKVLYPLLQDAAARAHNPLAMTSVWMRENDYPGSTYIRLFWGQMSVYLDDHAPGLFEKGLIYLQKACRLTWEQLELEEEILGALT
ncbi:hemerythrin domain-containing protein [Paenibacillus xanthanilyticus]|uniref:Hemerythrin domain-containing protein n=1 Tax=Paenibacillus xanthanilyticus TaxID=1783531 RepID=A0ABV8JXP8_9BACL